MPRIGVVGAGAIGGWVAARLAEGGNSVSVLARGQTLSAIQENGLTLSSNGTISRYSLLASDEPEKLGEQEFLILAVKGPALPSLAKRLIPMIAPDTTIIPLLNGVPWWFMGEGVRLTSVNPEADGDLASAMPFSQVLGCVVHASASSPQPGIVELRMADRLIVGEPLGGISKRTKEVVDLLKSSSLPGVACGDIRREIWYKLWGNMTMNPISALTLATADKILDDQLVERLICNVMAEAREIGARIGCAIDQQIEDRNAVTRLLGAFKTSMLQDVEAGRQLELDALLNAPREIAKRVGFETPWIDSLFGLARLMGASRKLY